MSQCSQLSVSLSRTNGTSWYICTSYHLPRRDPRMHQLCLSSAVCDDHACLAHLVKGETGRLTGPAEDNYPG